MARIAVGGFQHETNTFAPQRATWADFERADAWPGFVRGLELIDAVEGFNLPIAGAVNTLQGLGHVLVLGAAILLRRARSVREGRRIYPRRYRGGRDARRHIPRPAWRDGRRAS